MIREEILEKILEKVTDIISNNLGIEKEEISVKSSLMHDLNADSLDAIEIIMGIESEFDFNISDEEAEGLVTVKNIVDYVEKRLNG